MEPQINYGSGSFQNQPVYGQQKVYGRKGKAGCFGFIGAAILLVLIIVGGIMFGYPALTPNGIHGDFLDMAIVPQKDGSQKLWILTDGSFRFIQTTKSPGSYSTGVKCYFCKTWTYIYDPIAGKIEKKTKTELNDIITKTDVVYSNGKVWQITAGYGKNEPRIDVYDAYSGELVMDSKGFTDKYPILSSGIATLSYTEKENYISFDTKDGRKQIQYFLDDDKLYTSYSERINEKQQDTSPGTVAVLSPETQSSKRFKMYKVTGPRNELDSRRSMLESSVLDNNTKRSLEKFDIQPVSNKIFIEGLIYYQDDQYAVVIYLDQSGKKADRYITCVDLKAGTDKWTLGPDDIFDKMKIDENKNAFSSVFFTKSNIKVKRAGNLVALELKGDGVMGFDLTTGKKLWQMDI